MMQDRIQQEMPPSSLGAAELTGAEPYSGELQTVYDTAPMGLCTLDRELRYLRINPWLALLNGAPVESHLGRTLREMAPKIADKVEPVLHRLLENGEAVTGFEVSGRIPGRSGRRHLAVTFLPIFGPDGVVAQVNAWVYEVTESHAARQQLEKMNRELALAHRWLNGIINSTSDCIAALDTDGRLVAFNGAFAREFELLFGRSLHLGLSIDQVLEGFPADRDSALRAVKKALFGKPFCGVHDFGRFGARRRLYEITLNAIRDPEGEPIGTALAGRNVTRRVETEERFRAAAECLSDVIFEWDLRDRIEWFGDVDTMMGHAPGGFPRHASGWVDSLHPADRPGVVAAIKDSLARHTSLGGQFRVRRHNGDYAVWLARGRAVRNTQGVAQSWVGAITDVTEQRRTAAVMAARMRLMTFAQTHPLAELLRKTVDEAESLTESQAGFFHFALADQKTLVLQAWSTNTVKSLCTAEGARSHYPLESAGVWADCARERRPIIHNDYENMPHRTGLPPGHAPVRRELTVPVMRGGLIAAVLGVGNKAEPYTEDDVKTVSALADFGWDIAEHKRYEEALQESERRYRSLVDNTETGLVVINEAGAVLETNEAYVRMTGERSSEEVIGRAVLDWTAPDHRDMHHAAESLCAKQGYLRDFETVFLGRDHRRRHILVNAVVHDTPRGRHTVAFCRDITERKLSEMHLVEMRAALTERVRELETATAHIHTLQGIIPICMHCHKIRDDQQLWQRLELYIQEHSDAQFSHGLCPECAEKHYGNLDEEPDAGG